MAAIAVTAPDPGFTGTRAGVAFEDGTGEVDADNALALAYFARHGYALDDRPSPAKKDRPPTAPTTRAASTSSEGASPDA